MLLQTHLENIEQLKYQVARIKTVVDSYLANTNEPIDERWALYQALPSFLRNHENWVQDFLVRSDGSFAEIYEFRDFNRDEVIDVHSFLLNYQDEISEYNDEHEIRISATLTREYILSKNLGSFENDW